MRVAILLTFVFCTMSCTSKYAALTLGHYVSTCYLHRYPTCIIKLERDSTFEYSRAYLEEKITGTWVLRKDTLILKSELFALKKTPELWPRPKYKNTDYSPTADAYLLKKRKLIVLDSDGIPTPECGLEWRQ